MASNDRIITPGGGYKSRVNLFCPQIGIVKDNADSQNMGRLKVWIKGSTTLEQDPNGWITCSYGSPFAGATDPELLGNDLQDPDSTQISYGFWAVPPDINNSVIVIFVNGDIKEAYWISCLYQKDMNYMVPGIAGGLSYQGSQYDNANVPVSEYNKMSTKVNERPVYSPLANGLKNQGLLSDPLRGAGTSTARRESPSNVFGFSTPGGNQFIMDDGDSSELIRIRTKSGVQILLSETTGHIYMITKDGKNWFEMNNGGYIDIYSTTGINLNTIGDLNLRSQGTVSIEGKNVNIKSTEHTTVQSSGDFVTVSGKDTVMSVHGTYVTAKFGDEHRFRPEGAYNDIHDNLNHPAIDMIDNSPPGFYLPGENQQSLKNTAGQEEPVQTICTRVPDAEPWEGHAEITPIRVVPQEGASSASKGSVTSNAARPLPLVGTPSKGMKPGIYSPDGYDAKGQPKYTYNGPTTALLPVNQLVTSDAGLEFIKSHEGFRATPYRDTTSMAIGYGHNIIPTDPAIVKTGPLSIEQGTALLKQDVKKFEDAIRKNVTVPLTQAQFDSLVDFTYNLGAGAFVKSTLLKELNAGNYSEVPNQLARWVYAEGSVLPALVSRRRAEGLLFAKPVATN